MNKVRLNTLIENTDHHTCKVVLSILLSAHAFPVFGAAKSIEHEVAAFHALEKKIIYQKTQMILSWS